MADIDPRQGSTPAWVSVKADDAPEAANAAVAANGGRVLRVVPTGEGQWQVQLADLANPVRTAPPTPGPAHSRGPRWRLRALVAGVALTVVAVLIATAAQQRSSAASWRERSRVVTIELDTQRHETERLRDALQVSETTASELRDDVARLAAEAAARDDAAAAAVLSETSAP